ncbi:MAG: hypothetical protein IKJ33_04905 [Clostridia bacterium]|nr:hypothetical protein [Clostridia bacterium]
MKDYSSIVISSNVRFRRNLVGFNFPSTLDEITGVKVLNKLADTILKLDEEYKIYKTKTLSEIDRNIMFEKGLLSNRVLSTYDYSATILSKDEDISFMLNENDHLVETCTKPGLNLILAYDTINAIDNEILSKLDIAFDDSFGFLTSNIGQVGTGLEVCVRLFLPGLSLTNKIRNVQAEINSQGFDIKISADSVIKDNEYLFSISNTQTIGRRETDYVIKITEMVIKICEMEIFARNELLSKAYIDEVKDKVFRAWGVATNCYKISSSEAQKILTELKIGVALDFIRFKEVGCIDNLLEDVMPYSLTKISEMKILASDLDKYRATFLANVLKSKRIK